MVISVLKSHPRHVKDLGRTFTVANHMVEKIVVQLVRSDDVLRNLLHLALSVHRKQLRRDRHGANVSKDV